MNAAWTWRKKSRWTEFGRFGSHAAAVISTEKSGTRDWSVFRLGELNHWIEGTAGSDAEARAAAEAAVFGLFTGHEAAQLARV